MDLIEDTSYVEQYVDELDNSIFISAIEGEGIDKINKVLDSVKKIERNEEDVAYIHVTLLPYIYGSNELKSKPTQHSVKELNIMESQIW